MTKVVIAIWAATLAVDQRLLSDRFNPREVPIFQSRIARVPDEHQSRALQLLGKKDFIALSEKDLSVLFGGKSFNYKEMLSAQAEAADSYAIKREQEAGIQSLEEQRPALSEEAKAHRNYSRYTKSLSPRLIPYLVKVQIGWFDGTDLFVLIRPHDMAVSLSGRPYPFPKPIPVVVFAEHEIASVSGIRLGQ